MRAMVFGEGRQPAVNWHGQPGEQLGPLSPTLRPPDSAISPGRQEDTGDHEHLRSAAQVQCKMKRVDLGMQILYIFP